MKPQRKGPRRGRWRSLPALPIVSEAADLRADHERLTQRGFVLRDKARCYHALNGRITLRLVWRRRKDGSTATHEVVMRFPAAVSGGLVAQD